MATVDDRGRVADRYITAALGWDGSTRLSIREHDGLLVITADPHGVVKLSARVYLRFPAQACRAAGLGVGDRVLLTAHLDHQTLTAFPPRALDELLMPALPGGEDQ
ncbi:hypothetical protein [Lentzea jiangxiensis]|nr:hypothetical protein [Lentzea jiangxiensis]